MRRCEVLDAIQKYKMLDASETAIRHQKIFL